MKSTRLREIEAGANKLLGLLFDGDIIDYNLEYKMYEEEKFLGSFSANSMHELEPRIYVNMEIDYLFVDEGIYDNNTRKTIEVDTVLHEYGHLLYELIDGNGSGFMDGVEDFLRKELQNEIEIVEIEEEVYEVRKGNEVWGGMRDEEELSDFLSYEAEEIFAEDFAMYVRMQENSKEYLEIKPNFHISQKRQDFFKVVIGQVKKMKLELFEEDMYLRKKETMGIEFTMEKTDEMTEITIHSSGEIVGRCAFKEDDIDTFVEYEIDNYLDERQEAGDIEEYEVDKFLSFKDHIEDKEVIYTIAYFEINDGFRQKGLGSKLFQTTLEYIDNIIDDDVSMLYLNASPNFQGMNLVNLTKFYEGFGFNLAISQGGNNLMSMLDSDNIKKVLRERYVQKENTAKLSPRQIQR